MILGNTSIESRAVMRVWRGKNQDAFIRAQHDAISQLIPVLYIVIIIACLALSISIAASTPYWAALSLPIALLVPIAFRLRYWLSVQGKSDVMPIEKVRRDVLHTNYLGPLIALLFTISSVLLMSKGALHYELAGIATWVLAITSAFCLAAAPVASLAIVVSASVPLTVTLFLSASPLLQTMSGVVILVSTQVAYMLVRNYISFFDMVHSKVELQKSKEAAETAEQISTMLANTDHLTALPNRRYFEQMLVDTIMPGKLITENRVVGILDLDGFKSVNDVYGHNAGDEVLIQVATRLKTIFGSTARVARMGGDEFAFLTTDSELSLLTGEIQSSLSEPYTVHPNRIVRLACSIGAAIHHQNETDPLKLIAQADIALYQSKANGKGVSTLFTPVMELANLERARIEQGLRKAISNDELGVQYQPIYEVATNRLAGFEALARWNDAELGSISPAVFIPIAEESGLVGPLTELMLRKAATAAAAWPSELYLSFNVSAEQLVRESAGLRFVAVLAECGLSPSRLEVEVTETAIMKDLNAALRTLENLKTAGARISLDDFGTGFSSLSQIRNLPLSKIKIDRSFIDSILADEKTRGLVETIVTMCRTLDIKCTAEGVEHQDQLTELRRIGCHSAQGYLLARPMSLASARRLIDKAYPSEISKRKRRA
jgi:diguanylate cyclase (GGDEF)-like protein